MNLVEQYNIALAVSQDFHREQKDRAGKPYIEHAMRVSSSCKTLEAKIVGLLHDIVEDTPCTLKHLEDIGFNSDIVDAVRILTRAKGQRYNNYIANISRNNLASEVKMRDLEDNMDISRLPSVTKLDEDRQRKYMRACQKLTNKA